MFSLFCIIRTFLERKKKGEDPPRWASPYFHGEIMPWTTPCNFFYPIYNLDTKYLEVLFRPLYHDETIYCRIVFCKKREEDNKTNQCIMRQYIFSSKTKIHKFFFFLFSSLTCVLLPSGTTHSNGINLYDVQSSLALFTFHSRRTFPLILVLLCKGSTWSLYHPLKRFTNCPKRFFYILWSEAFLPLTARRQTPRRFKSREHIVSRKLR